MERKVPEQLESLGKMLIRGTYKQIANAAWRSPLSKKELQLIALKEIDKNRVLGDVLQEGAKLCEVAR